jgi:hypothetical protein
MSPYHETLVTGLAQMRIRPYYLYHAIYRRVLDHFLPSSAREIEISEGLRGHVSAFATDLVVDHRWRRKDSVLPNYVISTSPHRTGFTNYEGVISRTQNKPSMRRMSFRIATTAENRRGHALSSRWKISYWSQWIKTEQRHQSIRSLIDIFRNKHLEMQKTLDVPS